jgi:hypothetical protein
MGPNGTKSVPPEPKLCGTDTSNIFYENCKKKTPFNWQDHRMSLYTHLKACVFPTSLSPISLLINSSPLLSHPSLCCPPLFSMVPEWLTAQPAGGDGAGTERTWPTQGGAAAGDRVATEGTWPARGVAYGGDVVEPLEALQICRHRCDLPCGI